MPYLKNCGNLRGEKPNRTKASVGGKEKRDAPAALSRGVALEKKKNTSDKNEKKTIPNFERKNRKASHDGKGAQQKEQIRKKRDEEKSPLCPKIGRKGIWLRGKKSQNHQMGAPRGG